MKMKLKKFAAQVHIYKASMQLSFCPSSLSTSVCPPAWHQHSCSRRYFKLGGCYRIAKPPRPASIQSFCDSFILFIHSSKIKEWRRDHNSFISVTLSHIAAHELSGLGSFGTSGFSGTAASGCAGAASVFTAVAAGFAASSGFTS